MLCAAASAAKGAQETGVGSTASAASPPGVVSPHHTSGGLRDAPQLITLRATARSEDVGGTNKQRLHTANKSSKIKQSIGNNKISTREFKTDNDTHTRGNLLNATVNQKEKHTAKTKAQRRLLKQARPHRRRRVTKEKREFWNRLDQRQQLRTKNNTSLEIDGNSKKQIHTNTSQTLNSNDTIYEDFPFLSTNYDYNDYYYEEDFTMSTKLSGISSSSDSSVADTSSMNPTGTSDATTISLLIINNSAKSTNTFDYSTVPSLIINETTPKFLNTSESAPVRINDKKIKPTNLSIFIALPSLVDDNATIKYNEIIDNEHALGATTLPTVTLKKHAEEFPIISKLEARIMPRLAAEETSQIPQFSFPMTAMDSFRSRRINNDDDSKLNRPRDILKEFPIFRQFRKSASDTEDQKILSLHERLQSHLTTTVILANDLAATDVLATEDVTQSTHVTQPSLVTTEKRISSESSATETNHESPITNTNVSVSTSNGLSTQGVNPQGHTIIQQIERGEKAEQLLFSNSSATIISNVTENIKTNVTFSTSRTQEVIQTSADLIAPPIFKSQLGVAPLGATPFGRSPFGEIPLGKKPFGLSPEGVSPLGNLTSNHTENRTTDESLPKDGLDGRYHVQVTGPDGSINGDYIVVDPVTGDLNGVRYEVAQDVDPLLVQRALLKFLSLDPRLSPASINSEPPSDDPVTSSSDKTYEAERLTSNLVLPIAEPTVPPETTTNIAQ